MSKRELQDVDRLKALIEQALSGQDSAADGRNDTIESLVQKLSIYYRELEFQNDELKRVGKELETAKSRYRDLFMEAPVGYAVYDQNYTAVSMNRRFAQLLGLDSASQQGPVHLEHYIEPESQDEFYFHVRNLKPGACLQCIIHLRTADGRKTVQVESTRPQTDHEASIRSAFVDITERETLAGNLKAVSRELETRNADLQQYHDRLEATMLAGNLAWWSMELPSGLVEFNEQKTRMLGYRAADFTHYKDFTALVHPDDYPGMMQAMEAYLRDQSAFYRCEYRIKAADGTYTWFQDTGIASARDRDGKPATLVGVVVDITELKRALLEAERATRAKSEFLANMSHEIRTPLNAIIGFTELLQESPLGTTERRYLAAAHESARSLLDIINDILDLSKIEAGKLELETVPVDLPALLERTCTMFRMTAERKGLDFHFQADPDLPATVYTDPVRLKQVLVNLLGNAVKFCERGGVGLSVRKLGPDPDGKGSTLRFEVTDTGIGIRSEDTAKLFKAFSQGDTSVTRRFGGTGLGLVISASIVRAMGGTLEFSSEAGSGSTFWFSLPLRSAAMELPPESSGYGSAESGRSAKDLEQAEPLPADATGCGKTVLLAEDSPINRLLVRALLQRFLPELRILEAADGRKALELASKERCDLILMDIQMPVLDGLSAIRALRAATAGPVGDKALPIVALSAGASTHETEEALAAGADHYITKPIDSRLFRRLLAELLYGQGSAGPTSAACGADSADAEAPEYFSADLLLKQTGDPVFFRELLTLSLEQLDSYRAELLDSFERGDTAAIKHHAHKMRGAAASLYCQPLTEILQRIERAAAGSDRIPEPELEGLAADFNRLYQLTRASIGDSNHRAPLI